MSKLKRTLIQKAVIAPAVIGAVTAALFFASLPVAAELFPLDDKEIGIAEFEQGLQETAFVKGNAPAEGKLKKSDILFKEKNKCIGCIELSGKSIPIAADADSVSLLNALSFSSKGNYIGEVGCAYVYGFNSVLNTGVLSVNSDVKVETEYGSFVFTVKEIKKAASEYDVYSSATDVSRGLMLYTNTDNGVGISSSFDAVVMEMKSGPSVYE